MPINTNLNIAPYFDDFNLEKQFYKILFKPAYAVQARELTQLQTILQNQVEQFGDNIYKEGSIVKGCNFTTLDDLEFVKLTDKTGFDPESYIGGVADELVSGVTVSVDTKYEIVGQNSQLKASIITASRGFETRPPDLNTFYINYLNTTPGRTRFIGGENLTINKYRYNGSVLIETSLNVASINVTNLEPSTGSSYGIQAADGVVFQKGHFLFANSQTLIVSKYTNQPNDLSVGYEVVESLVSSLQDPSLFDNANGSNNENAPGADRLKMVPTLTVKTTSVADVDSGFFTLIRYQNGFPVTIRDVTQFNSISEEMAKRTYEESGDYVISDFKSTTERRGTDLKVLVGKGTAYVKGYRVENRGNQDVTIDPISATEIQENQSTSLEYGSYVDITAIQGTVDVDYSAVTLQRSTGQSIGQAFVTNITPSKLYLFGVSISVSSYTFADVTRIVGTAGVITIAAGSKLKQTNKSPLVFNTGTKSLKELTDISLPVRAQDNSVSVTNDVLTIGPLVGADFGVDNSDMVFVDASNTVIPVLSYTTSVNNSVLTVNLDPAANSDPAGTLYYNKRELNVTPYNKQSVEAWVKFIWNNGTTQYNLGFPDVYEILAIEDNLNVDYKDSFRLVTNQKDNFYDHSYLEVIPGRPLPTAGTISVKLKVFKPSNATGKYFFAINSYPVDDVSTNLPSGYVRSTQIPVYTADTGREYRLRECVDFRPYRDLDGGASYTASTEASASVVSNAVGDQQPAFTTYTFEVPALNGSLTSDIEHYLSRIDMVTIDSFGKVATIKGTEAASAIPPKVGADQLVITQVSIPGFPALSPKEAIDQNKDYYAVKTKASGVRNYTMKDISGFDKRIKNLEYYVSLNQLEQSTQNMVVTDENGLTRFKNGFLVDPFNDTNISNLQDATFSAAIQKDDSILSPSLTTFPLDLKYKSATGSSVFPSTADAEIATLGRNDHAKIVGQPYGTNFRNLVSNYWSYNGTGQLSPNHDMAHDTTSNPVTLDIDLVTPFTDFIENLQTFIPLTQTTTVNNGSVTNNIGGRTWQTVTDFTDTTTSLGIDPNSVPVNNTVGDFVSDFQFSPFMRARDVKIFIAGLRPDTPHYFYFDGVAVTDKVRAGDPDSTTARDVQPFGALNSTEINTDSNGVLRAVFELPGNTFFVGERTLTVADSSTFADIESASTSRASMDYHAYNISIEKSSLTTSTRVPDIDVTSTVTTRSVAGRPFNIDPLAQTFFVKSGMGRGANSIFASKIDLYFKRKSEINGITVMLREVVNGYPSSAILPFSKIHLQASSVNVSDDASAVTTVDFDAPVRLDIEKEYAIVIMPDANDPNYLTFTSKVGGTDLTPGATQGQAVVQDWGDGVLFSSTNNMAWKSYQDEDLKFTIYRHKFNSGTGAVTMTNDDHEFFTLSDWTGRFSDGEEIYTSLALSGSTSSSVTMVSGTNVISGTALGDTYAAGDRILIAAGINKEIFEIASVDSSTEMTATKKISYQAGAGSTGTPVVTGTISHYNPLERGTMHLVRSSATNSKKFLAGQTITGLRSTITGTIGSVDNINLSYVQPLIMKTNDSATSTELSGVMTDPANTSTNYTMPMQFGAKNTFNKKGVTVFSRSNDIALAKPFEVIVNMTNGSSETTSPVVDLETASLLAYQYRVTNSADTTSKYISKTIELAEDLDAEDMEVVVTAYKPSGSDIKIYIKPQNVYDSASFASIPWMELEAFEGGSSFSSDLNLQDYREIKYRVKAANQNGGVLEYTSSGGTFLGYRKFAIRIDMISEDIAKVPTLRDMRALALT